MSCLKPGNKIGNEDRKVISYSEKYQGNIEELLQWGVQWKACIIMVRVV